MEIITPDFLAAYSVDDMTADELQSERRQYLLASIAEDEAREDISELTNTELAWLERNPARLVDSTQTKKTQRRQFLLAHIALRGDAPIGKRNLKWLENKRLIRRQPTGKGYVVSEEVLDDPFIDDPEPSYVQSELFGIVDGVWGWDEPQELENDKKLWNYPYPTYREYKGWEPMDSKEFAWLCDVIKTGEPAIAMLKAHENGEHMLSDAELKECQALVADREDAVWIVFEQNYGLVVGFITRKFAHLRGQLLTLVDRQDLMQEAALGLMRAIEKFDPEVGTSLSTYAEYWMRHKINLYIKKNKESMHASLEILDLMRRLDDYSDSYGEQAIESLSATELAEEFGVSPKKMNNALLARTRRPVSLEASIEEARQSVVADATDYMDESELSERAMALVRVCMDPAEKMNEAAETSVLDDVVIERLFKRLPAREKDIMYRRLGAGPYAQQGHETLEEIGQEYERTRERIRQIEAVARKRLRSNLPSSLNEYLSVDTLPKVRSDDTSRRELNHRAAELYKRCNDALADYPEGQRATLGEWLKETKRIVGFVYGNSSPGVHAEQLTKRGWRVIVEMSGVDTTLTWDNLDRTLLQIMPQLEQLNLGHLEQSYWFVLGPTPNGSQAKVALWRRARPTSKSRD